MVKDFQFKKKYGQNFLTDKNKINEIISKAEIDENTLVIEIGPGSGALTSFLAEKSKNVVAFEIDEELKEDLSKLEECYSNLKVIYQDFLTVELKEIIKQYIYEKLYIVSNLPYYITTPIIEKLIKEQVKISKMVLMMQKETGTRFLAKKGDEDYNSIQVIISYYFNVSKLATVDRNCFYPIPNVDSVVLLFEEKKEKLLLNDESFFISVVQNAFNHKRKNLRNNLKKYNLRKIQEIGIDLSKRAEQLSLEEFVNISNYLFINK